MAGAAVSALAARVSSRPKFYLYMALLCAAAAFGGFFPTFWLPMMHGAYVAAPVIAIHGLLFFLWILFLVLQAWFAASGQIANHRAAGLFGIALASVITVFGCLVEINEIHRSAAVGHLNDGLSSSILPLWHIAFFAATVAAAIANISRPEWHKRLMLAASISILNAPLARPFIYFMDFRGHMPVPAGLPSPVPPLDGVQPEDYATDAIFLIPIAYDWLKRGRPHPAYLITGGAFVALELLQTPLSQTAAWHGIASWFYSLAG